MRPAALLMLLAAPLTAAPVPKANPKAFNENLLGVWKLTGVPKSANVTLEFQAKGVVICRVANERFGRDYSLTGKYTLTEPDGAGKPWKVKIEYEDGPKLNEDWVVREWGEDGLKVTETNAGVKDEYRRVEK